MHTAQPSEKCMSSSEEKPLPSRLPLRPADPVLLQGTLERSRQAQLPEYSPTFHLLAFILRELTVLLVICHIAR